MHTLIQAQLWSACKQLSQSSRGGLRIQDSEGLPEGAGEQVREQEGDEVCQDPGGDLQGRARAPLQVRPDQNPGAQDSKGLNFL